MAVLPAVTQTGGKKQNVHQQVNGKSNDGIKQQNTTQQQKEKNYWYNMFDNQKNCAECKKPDY